MVDQAQCIGIRREHNIYRMAVINQNKTIASRWSIVICSSCLVGSGERKRVGPSLSLAREKEAGEVEIEEEKKRERERERQREEKRDKKERRIADKVRSNSTREDKNLLLFLFSWRLTSFSLSLVRINILLLSSSLIICYITSSTISADKRQFELDKTGYRPDTDN